MSSIFGATDPYKVKHITADPNSSEVHIILPVVRLGVVNKEDFAIADDFERIYRELYRGIGKADLTLMKTLDGIHFAHPRDDRYTVKQNYHMQQNYSIGKLEYIFPKADENKVVWGSYNVTDPTAKQVALKYRDAYNKGVVPLFTSSQFARTPDQDKHNIKEFDIMHTTLTDEPAYGKEFSQVGAVCQGPLHTCVNSYAAAGETSSPIGVNIHGDVIDLFFEQCPFCIETEMTNLFENNLKINNDYILNSASITQMSSEEKKTPQILNPEEDQNKKSEPFNADALATAVIKKLDEQKKSNEVNTVEEAKKRTDDHLVKNDAAELKPFDIKSHPDYIALEERVKQAFAKIDEVTGTIKQKDDTINKLSEKASETEIGDILAEHEYNFYDPETQKVDPAKWEEAFKFALENKLSPTQLRNYLKTFSPYGSKPRKMEQVIAKASTNRGVPKFESAFDSKEVSEVVDETKTKMDSASTIHEIPAGIRLIRSIVRENSLD